MITKLYQFHINFAETLEIITRKYFKAKLVITYPRNVSIAQYLHIVGAEGCKLLVQVLQFFDERGQVARARVTSPYSPDGAADRTHVYFSACAFVVLVSENSI